MVRLENAREEYCNGCSGRSRKCREDNGEKITYVTLVVSIDGSQGIRVTLCNECFEDLKLVVENG